MLRIPDYCLNKADISYIYRPNIYQMNYPELSKKVQDYVQSLFRAQKEKSFLYHNLSHTESVVRSASQIANHYQLNEKDFFIVTTAAWFHDTGYFSDAKKSAGRNSM